MGSETAKGIPEFICVRIDDPGLPKNKCDAIIRTSSIVSIVKRDVEIFKLPENNPVVIPFHGDKIRPKYSDSKTESHYIITDSLGRQYFTQECCRETQQTIASIWASCFQT